MKSLPKIKIAFNGSCLSGKSPGGWSRYTSCLIEQLRSDYSEQLEIFIFENTTQINHSLWEQRDLPRLCAQNNIDLLHAPANGGLPLQGNFKKVLTIHDLFSEEEFQWQSFLTKPKTAIRYKLDWWLSLRAADTLLTVSEFSKKQILNYGLHQPLYCIYEGVQLPPPDPKVDLPSTPFLLYVGSFEKRKNTQELIETFLKTTTPLKLVLIGKGGEEHRSQSPSDRLVFVKEASDATLSRYYSEAFAFITFSRTEGFGLPLAEALACGCPVLYTGEGAIPEIVGAGGLKISPQNLSQTLTQLLSEPPARQELQKKAREQSFKFSWKKTAQETFEVYRSLLSSQVKSSTTRG